LYSLGVNLFLVVILICKKRNPSCLGASEEDSES
jgi:hypothetical protein